MTKTVSNGCRNCTVNLDGTECAVTFDSPYRAFAVQNDSEGDVCVSITAGKVAGDDGVITVKSGRSAVIAHMRSDVSTVYITGKGAVQVAAQNTAENPFKNAPAGQGGGITVGGLEIFGNSLEIFDIGAIEEE